MLLQPKLCAFLRFSGGCRYGSSCTFWCANTSHPLLAACEAKEASWIHRYLAIMLWSSLCSHTLDELRQHPRFKTRCAINHHPPRSPRRNLKIYGTKLHIDALAMPLLFHLHSITIVHCITLMVAPHWNAKAGHVCNTSHPVYARPHGNARSSTLARSPPGNLHYYPLDQ
jgi:hypothetical protein